MQAPRNIDEWADTLRARLLRENRELGINSSRVCEVFTVTAWGELPTVEQLRRDFPGLSEAFSNLDRLGERIARWTGQR